MAEKKSYRVLIGDWVQVVRVVERKSMLESRCDRYHGKSYLIRNRKLRTCTDEGVWRFRDVSVEYQSSYKYLCLNSNCSITL